MPQTLTRWNAFVLVVAVWAGIYLPALGGRELKGEEGRRILPAVTMLENGNWMLPSVGGEDYYNKPPFINWLVAAAFVVTGEQSEWSARLPSVVFLLAFATLLIWMPAPTWFKLPARLLAAIVCLTNIGLVEFGRMIEIEAVYVALTGLATYWWLNIWSRNGSRWTVWLGAGVILGASMLAKGPISVGMFYLTVLAVLWYAGRLRDLFTLEHVVGFLIMFLMSAGWAYLAARQTASDAMTSKWTTEWLIRFIPDNVTVWRWLGQVLKEIQSFLPWALFLPLLWSKRVLAAIGREHRPIFKGCRLAVIAAFIGINLMWGVRARYIYPVFPVLSILVGWAMAVRGVSAGEERVWRHFLLFAFLLVCLASGTGLVLISTRPLAWAIAGLTVAITAAVFWRERWLRGVLNLTVATALLMSVGIFQYAVFGMAIMREGQKLRTSAAMVNKIVPAEETVYVFRPGNQPFLFYIRPPLEYVLEVQELDEEVRYLLLEKAWLEELRKYPQIASRSPRVAYTFTKHIRGRYRLIELRS